MLGDRKLHEQRADAVAERHHLGRAARTLTGTITRTPRSGRARRASQQVTQAAGRDREHDIVHAARQGVT